MLCSPCISQIPIYLHQNDVESVDGILRYVSTATFLDKLQDVFVDRDRLHNVHVSHEEFQSLLLPRNRHPNVSKMKSLGVKNKNKI